MNKEERLHRLLGEIDDDLVADAARKPIRKAVWVPAVAAAACVALTVGLWQGGVFDPAPIPVEPDEGASVTEPAEPSKDTTTSVTTVTSTTTAKSTEPSKDTTTTESYILVGGEEDYESITSSSEPSLKDRLVSPALEEKMKEYRNVNAVYQVVVFAAITVEDVDEFDNFLKADKEYQSLRKQSKEAHTAANKAYERYFKYREDALQNEARKAVEKADKIDRQITELTETFLQKFADARSEERISYAAKYSKTEPIYGYGPHGTGYYMELTADAINELADRGGYSFNLAGEKRKEGVDEVANA